MITVPCCSCGSCCKAVKCSLLTKENKCPDYENRPVFCNVMKMYSMAYSKLMSLKDFVRLEQIACYNIRYNRMEEQWTL